MEGDKFFPRKGSPPAPPPAVLPVSEPDDVEEKMDLARTSPLEPTDEDWGRGTVPVRVGATDCDNPLAPSSPPTEACCGCTCLQGDDAAAVSF